MAQGGAYYAACGDGTNRGNNFFACFFFSFSFFFFFLGENRKDPLLHSYSSTSLGFPCRNQVISPGTIISLFHHLFDSSAQAVNKVL